MKYGGDQNAVPVEGSSGRRAGTPVLRFATAPEEVVPKSPPGLCFL